MVREHDALVGEYVHLKGFGREKEALEILMKVASLVKPLMRARKWRVGQLVEFYPVEEPDLQGECGSPPAGETERRGRR